MKGRSDHDGCAPKTFREPSQIGGAQSFLGYDNETGFVTDHISRRTRNPGRSPPELLPLAGASGQSPASRPWGAKIQTVGAPELGIALSPVRVAPKHRQLAYKSRHTAQHPVKNW